MGNGLTISTTKIPERESKGVAFVKHHIVNNYIVGQKLPNEVELVRQLGVSRYSANRAFSELSAEGIVERKKRAGTFMISSPGDLNSQPHVNNTSIAFISDEFESFISMEYLRGVEQSCSMNDYQILLLNFDYDIEKAKEFLKKVVHSGCPGAIMLLSICPESVHVLDEYIPNDFPLVLLDRRDTEKKFLCIKMNQKKAAYDATNHLVSLGHRKIALLTYDDTSRPRLEEVKTREAGYICSLKEAGIEVKSEFIQRGPYFSMGAPVRGFYKNHAYQPMNKLLLQKDRPTAVFCVNSTFLYGAFQAIQDHGLRVPDDISIVCIDDDPAWRNAMVPLTVVRQPLRDMGALAFDYLKQEIETGESLKNTIMVEGELIIRNSTAPPKKT